MISLSHASHELADAEIQNTKQFISQLTNRSDIGFFDLPNRDELWKSSQKRADEILAQADQVFFLGIGGSSLGGKTLLNSLKFCYPTDKVQFVDNVDAMTLDYVFSKISDPGRTHWS